MRKSLICLWVLAVALYGFGLDASAGSRHLAYEKVLERSFDVAPGGTLRAELPDADLELMVGTANRVEVVVLLGAHDLDWAMEHYREMNLRAHLEGNAVVIEADRVNVFSWRRNRAFSLKVEVRLPERFNLEVKAGDGDVLVEALDGMVEVQASDGDVQFGSLSGPRAEISSSDGDIQIDELTSARAKIKTADGEVQIRRLDGDSAEVRSSDGDIQIDRVAGALEAATQDGDIEVGIERFDTMLLESGDGDITIRAPQSMGAELDLRGEEVYFRSSVAFEGTREDARAQGSLNGGGPRLRATTRDGSVTLSTR